MFFLFVHFNIFFFCLICSLLFIPFFFLFLSPFILKLTDTFSSMRVFFFMIFNCFSVHLAKSVSNKKFACELNSTCVPAKKKSFFFSEMMFLFFLLYIHLFFCSSVSSFQSFLISSQAGENHDLQEILQQIKFYSLTYAPLHI